MLCLPLKQLHGLSTCCVSVETLEFGCLLDWLLEVISDILGFSLLKKNIENYFKQNSSLRKVWDATTQKYLVRKLLKIFGYIKETTVHLPQNYFSHSGGDILLCFIPHTLSLPFIRYLPLCHLRKIIHQVP